MNLLLDADLDTKQALLNSLGPASCLVENQGDGFVSIAIYDLYREYYGLAPDTRQITIDAESMHKASGTPVKHLEPIALRMRTNVARCFATNEVIHTENQMPQPDGTEKWSRNSIAPIARDGGVAYVLVSVVDITDLVKARRTLVRTLSATASGFVTICAWCRSIEEDNSWVSLDEYVSEFSEPDEALCPECQASQNN